MTIHTQRLYLFDDLFIIVLLVRDAVRSISSGGEMSSFLADGLEEIGRRNDGRVSWLFGSRHFD